MEVSEIIVDYFNAMRANKNTRFVIPAVGRLSAKIHAGYSGRDPVTGKSVAVPENCAVSFTALNDESGASNQLFVNWLNSDAKRNSAAVEKQLVELGRTIRENLESSRHFRVPGIGEFIRKERPPRILQHPVTGAYEEIPAQSITVFKQDWSFKVALNRHLNSTDDARFEKLPTAPLKIPEGRSTFQLDEWPAPQEYWKLCQSLAVLALCYDDAQRYIAIPDLKPGLNYAALSNGEGDECHFYFLEGDALIRGFAHEVPMASWYNRNEPWPGTLDGLPEHLRQALWLDYLEAENTSFCVWYLESDNLWHKGAITRFPDRPSDDPDGSGYILGYYPFNPADYVKRESRYYSRKINLEVVQQIFDHQPLTQKMVRRLNRNCETPWEMFARTGYPVLG